MTRGTRQPPRSPVTFAGAFADEASDLLDGETLAAYRSRTAAAARDVPTARRETRLQLRFAVALPARGWRLRTA